jgi:hypothetical protein
MTGLMRLGACDLFIHGLGAAETDNPTHEGYDIITEEWFDRWLGIRIAPIALVTATCYLSLSDIPTPTSDEVARARWLAHHAMHDPELLHDEVAASERRRLVENIRIARRHSPERRDLFANLHELLESTRRAHAADLDALKGRAKDQAARFAERDIIYDRTWPFPLFPQSTLFGLRDEIRAAFASS